METKLFEKDMHRLAGYRAMAPVVCGKCRKETCLSGIETYSDSSNLPGNSAFQELQLHVHGTVVLAMTQLFYDSRLNIAGDVTLFHRLESLTRVGVKELDKLAMSPASGQDTQVCIYSIPVIVPVPLPLPFSFLTFLFSRPLLTSSLEVLRTR
jgi:hypothetical protein